MDLGGIIKKLRKHQGLNQTDFAKECGITQATLSLIENNENAPSKSTLENISKSLRVSEPLLYLLSVERKDIPKENAKIYDLFFPSIKEIMVKIFKH